MQAWIRFDARCRTHLNLYALDTCWISNIFCIAEFNCAYMFRVSLQCCTNKAYGYAEMCIRLRDGLIRSTASKPASKPARKQSTASEQASTAKQAQQVWQAKHSKHRGHSNHNEHTTLPTRLISCLLHSSFACLIAVLAEFLLAYLLCCLLRLVVWLCVY